MTTKYLQKASEADDRMILTKDAGFKTVGKLLGKVRKLNGIKQSDFMDQYFSKVWDDHDRDHNNSIPADEVQSLFEDILKADQKPAEEQDE